MRTSIRVKLPIHFSHSPPHSRGAFLRPGFAFWLRAPEKKGGGAPRDVPVLARHRLGLHITRQARRLARRLASHNAGRPPPGALTVAILGSGAALSLTGLASGSVT